MRIHGSSSRRGAGRTASQGFAYSGQPPHTIDAEFSRITAEAETAPTHQVRYRSTSAPGGSEFHSPANVYGPAGYYTSDDRTGRFVDIFA